MAVIWLDGMDLYSTASGLARKGYTGTTGSPNNFNTTGGRFGGGALILDSNSNPINFSAAAGDTYSCGFCFYAETNTAGYGTGMPIMTFKNGGSAGTIINQIGVDVNGAIKVGRGDFTTNNILSSANGLVVAATWVHIEVVITRHSSAGAVEIFVNGTSVGSTTGVNTGSASVDTTTISNSGSPGQQRRIDDIFLTDTAVSLGDCKVETLHPTADTAQKDWGRSTGSNNFANVDDVPPNDDSDYNTSATVGNKDLFDMSDLASTPSSIYAVQTVLISRKDDAATRELRTNLKSGGTSVNGATKGQSTTYGNFWDLYVTDPNTSAAWTGTNVNAIQLGYETVT